MSDTHDAAFEEWYSRWGEGETTRDVAFKAWRARGAELAASQRREQELQHKLEISQTHAQMEATLTAQQLVRIEQLQARLAAAEALVVKWRKMTFGLGTQMSCADDLEKCLTQVSANGEAAG